MKEPEVIYEDKNFLAVNKPAGLLVHGDKRPAPANASAGRHATSDKTKEETLVDWLLKKYPEIRNVGDDPSTRPGIVHRLDKDTSGVMLIAKNKGYFEYLKSLFQTHKVQKIYLAIVWGEPTPASGVINKPIGLKSGTTKRSVHAKNMKMIKEAETEYRTIKKLPAFVAAEKSAASPQSFSLLEVTPKTGRTHQIRVHLASIGHPVVGDAIYGHKKTASQGFPAARLMLHALSVEFSPVEGKKMKIEAEPPEEFLEFSKVGTLNE